MKKLMTMIAVLGLAQACLAAMNDALLTFSTPGPDKYADGSVVLDGECYALVWTKDGASFAGLKADCTPVADTDRVIYVAPVAKNGACPVIVYQIPAAVADELAGGRYGVYLLDTRVKGADDSTALASFVGRMPVAVNAQAAASEVVDGIGGVAAGGVVATAVSGVSVMNESIVDVPKITGIKVEGATISVTVAGMSPVVTYKVFAGEKPGTINSEIDAKARGDTFTFDKPDGKFFKIIGTRNFK